MPKATRPTCAASEPVRGRRHTTDTPVLTCDVSNTLYEPLRYTTVPPCADSAATLEMRHRKRCKVPERLSENNLNRHNLSTNVFTTIYDSALNAIGKGYDVCMGRDHTSDDAYNRLRKMYPKLKSECVVGQYRCHMTCNATAPLLGFVHITPKHVVYISIEPEHVQFAFSFADAVAIRQTPPQDAEDGTRYIRSLDIYTSGMQLLRFTDFKDVETADDAFCVADFLWGEYSSTHNDSDSDTHLPPLPHTTSEDGAADSLLGGMRSRSSNWSTASVAGSEFTPESSGSMRKALRAGIQR